MQRTTRTYFQYFTSTIPSTGPCVPSLFCISCVRHCYTHTLCLPRNPVISAVPSPVFAISLLSAEAAAFFPAHHPLNPLHSYSAQGDLVLPRTSKAETYGQIILRTLMYTVCHKTILISAKEKYKPSTVPVPVPLKMIDIVTRIETVNMFLA